MDERKLGASRVSLLVQLQHMLQLVPMEKVPLGSGLHLPDGLSSPLRVGLKVQPPSPFYKSASLHQNMLLLRNWVGSKLRCCMVFCCIYVCFFCPASVASESVLSIAHSHLLPSFLIVSDRW